MGTSSIGVNSASGIHVSPVILSAAKNLIRHMEILSAAKNDRHEGPEIVNRLLLEGQVQAPVFGDRDRLGQVLTNLLINAIKYSPNADTARICITVEQGRAIVSVQDFGIGIAEIHHKHLFKRFYRASDAEVNTYPGLGIDLYISQEIIKRHHGELWFESHKGAGSTFSFALPLKEMMG